MRQDKSGGRPPNVTDTSIVGKQVGVWWENDSLVGKRFTAELLKDKRGEVVEILLRQTLSGGTLVSLGKSDFRGVAEEDRKVHRAPRPNWSKMQVTANTALGTVEFRKTASPAVGVMQDGRLFYRVILPHAPHRSTPPTRNLGLPRNQPMTEPWQPQSTLPLEAAPRPEPEGKPRADGNVGPRVRNFWRRCCELSDEAEELGLNELWEMREGRIALGTG